MSNDLLKRGLGLFVIAAPFFLCVHVASAEVSLLLSLDGTRIPTPVVNVQIPIRNFASPRSRYAGRPTANFSRSVNPSTSALAQTFNPSGGDISLGEQSYQARLRYARAKNDYQHELYQWRVKVEELRFQENKRRREEKERAEAARKIQLAKSSATNSLIPTSFNQTRFKMPSLNTRSNVTLSQAFSNALFNWK